MVAIEKENPKLKGALPKDYARPTLDKHRLGELIDIIGKIGLDDDVSRSKDIFGRVYEYFLGRFAAAEGKGGGEFYTPRCVVKLLVRMLEPYSGRIFDPCCGSGGMFVAIVSRSHQTPHSTEPVHCGFALRFGCTDASRVINQQQTHTSIVAKFTVLYDGQIETHLI